MKTIKTWAEHDTAPKVYLSGKISGLQDLNKPKFEKWEKILTDRGYNVINPHKIDHKGAELWVDFMKADIKALMDCEMIAVLDDWAQSRGAVLEVLIASALEYKIVKADTMEELVLDNISFEVKNLPKGLIKKAPTTTPYSFS
jgi:hypothetical protein